MYPRTPQSCGSRHNIYTGRAFFSVVMRKQTPVYYMLVIRFLQLVTLGLLPLTGATPHRSRTGTAWNSTPSSTCLVGRRSRRSSCNVTYTPTLHVDLEYWGYTYVSHTTWNHEFISKMLCTNKVEIQYS